MADVAEIGVLGGPGLHALLEDARTVEVDTPYGPPSARVVIGDVGVRSVAFLPRHGPYCPRGRTVAVGAAQAAGWSVTDGGTLVVVEGPGFPTRAQSQWCSAQAGPSST